LVTVSEQDKRELEEFAKRHKSETAQRWYNRIQWPNGHEKLMTFGVALDVRAAQGTQAVKGLFCYQSRMTNSTNQEERESLLSVLTEKQDSLLALCDQEQKRNSYIGRLGRIMEPVIRPIGFTWEMGVSLISGMVAKETIISTLGVLYVDSSDVEQVSLSEKLKTVKNDAGELVYSPLVAFCFMLFVLLYFPCFASVVAIKNESGGWKWAFAAMFYTCVFAWIAAFVVYQAGRFFGL
jgi:ferrous iron transport protein B